MLAQKAFLNAVSSVKTNNSNDGEDRSEEDIEEHVMRMMEQIEQQADYDATEDELQELKAVILKIQGFIVKVTFSMIFVTNITNNFNRFANHLRRRSFF